RLQSVLRSTDNLARLSGDEFAIIIERISDARDVEPTLERLINQLNSPFELANQGVTTSVSIGVALYPDNGERPSSLLKHADIAMYQAKRMGKKQYCFFHPDMNELLAKRIDMEQELKQAISENQFQAYYQPRACVVSDKIKGFEALIRWFHPEKGMVSPAEFIPIAEETGQILEIGDIILDAACKQAASWVKAGWKGRISVNIAALQFQQTDLVKVVQTALAKANLDSSYLELEITEGTLIKNIEHTRSMLLRLKEIGIKIALDDFGTGYSSLSYLQQLPIDILKIDRSFIIEISHSTKAAQLSKAIINMAHSLGLEVVAEGIEEHSQLEFLRQSGCEEYQGFLFGKPMPASEINFD
ncbi:MAG: bifunctional diguanylate cyclase/phosphodiesterase, partial [Kangiellaceae bacterium]|nr:bifunctional diguanylate cyclase/phosphodiesterase [Kangiellaceae bacterium]